MLYLSLGSNLGHREDNIRQASAALVNAFAGKVRSSSLYETAPIDAVGEVFINCVLECDTELTLPVVLKLCQSIEHQLGRRRSQRNEPRPLDIDILLYRQWTVWLEDLQVPHPRMFKRAFVLKPLLEIAPDLVAPNGVPIARYIAAVGEQKIDRLDFG